MTINFLGIEWNIIGIVTYIFSMLVVTELCKFWLKKAKFYQRFTDSNLVPLILSWLIGIPCFFAVSKFFETGKEAIIQFVFLTAMTNGGYKLVKRVMRQIKGVQQ